MSPNPFFMSLCLMCVFFIKVAHAAPGYGKNISSQMEMNEDRAGSAETAVHKSCEGTEDCIEVSNTSKCSDNSIKGNTGCFECNCSANSRCMVEMDGANEKALCVCDEGYYLENEICKAKVCESNPCQNGGTCNVEQEAKTYACNCSENYSGKNCEIAEICRSNPCLNGGICNVQQDSKNYSCTCTSNHTGENCEIVNPCSQDPCVNGGTCAVKKDENDFICICTSSFAGRYCESKCWTDCDVGERQCIIKDGKPECLCKANFINGKLGCLECNCPANSICKVTEEDGNEETKCSCEKGYYLQDNVCKADDSSTTVTVETSTVGDSKITIKIIESLTVEDSYSSTTAGDLTVGGSNTTMTTSNSTPAGSSRTVTIKTNSSTAEDSYISTTTAGHSTVGGSNTAMTTSNSPPAGSSRTAMIKINSSEDSNTALTTRESSTVVLSNVSMVATTQGSTADLYTSKITKDVSMTEASNTERTTTDILAKYSFVVLSTESTSELSLATVDSSNIVLKTKGTSVTTVSTVDSISTQKKQLQTTGDNFKTEFTSKMETALETTISGTSEQKVAKMSTPLQESTLSSGGDGLTKTNSVLNEISTHISGGHLITDSITVTHGTGSPTVTVIAATKEKNYAKDNIIAVTSGTTVAALLVLTIMFSGVKYLRTRRRIRKSKGYFQDVETSSSRSSESMTCTDI